MISYQLNFPLGVNICRPLLRKRPGCLSVLLIRWYQLDLERVNPPQNI